MTALLRYAPRDFEGELERLAAQLRIAERERDEALQRAEQLETVLHGQFELRLGNRLQMRDVMCPWLTRSETIFLATLAITKRGVSRADMLTALSLYGGSRSDDAKMLDVLLCKIRRKARERGIDVGIRVVRARGWRIVPERLEAVRDLLWGER